MATPRRAGVRLRFLLTAILALQLVAPAAGAAAGLPKRLPRPAPDASRAAPFAPAQLPSALGSPVDCVILAPDSLADLFQPLADYQTRVGLPSVVRPLSIIRAADPRSNDLPQAVRTFLTRARDAWGTRWAILVGDQNALPMRYVRVAFSGPEDIPTDAYYADLDGSWDGNGNGIYGEVGDSLDMAPDLAVGRFSVATRADAETVVRKTLRYATSPLLPAGNRELFLAEVLSPVDWKPGQLVYQDAARQAESLRVHLPGCKEVDRYYENAGPYPGSIPLNRASALDALNRGYSVVDYMGHGYHSQVAVGSELLTLSDFSSLSNGDSLCLFVASNCATAAIDFDCIGERMLRNSGGGCFAYIGPTRNDFPGVAAKMNLALYDSLYSGGRTTLGEALENVRASLLPDARAEGQSRWGYFETVLLGAPTVPIWRCSPDTLLVTRPASVPLDDGSFTVTVMQSGSPAESALVVVWKSPDDYRTVYTDASGAATVPFHPATSGGFSLAVTRDGALPYLDSLTVTGSSAAHFTVAATGIGDGAEGNGDGRADAGEAFAVEGTLSNTGTTMSLSTVTMTYEALSAGLVVERGSAALPAIAAGASIPLPDSLRVRAAAAPNAGRSELLRVVVTDGARSDTSEIPLHVVAASLAPATCVFSDSGPGGNGNGVVDPGETVSVAWTIGNEGPGAARGVAVRLFGPSGGGAIVDTTGITGDIAVGAAAPTPSLRVTVGSDISGRLFDLELSDIYGHTWTFPIDALSPAAPTALRVVSSGLDRIQIAWTPPAIAGIAGYRIHRAPDDGSPLLPAPIPVRGSASYEDGGLPPLTRYRYAVSTVDSSGNESPLSAELLASTTPPAVPGWPLPLGRATSSSILLTDLDGDGSPELCVGADYLYVFRSDGTEWRDGDLNPVSVGIFSPALHYLASSPAAVDLDLDGVPELVAASWDDSLVAVFGADGMVRPGWPKKGAAAFWSTPAIGDIDGDGAAEIVVGSNSNRIYAWHADGTEVRDGDGNSATDGVFYVPSGTVISSPAIADLNRDGRREIVFGTSAGFVYALHAAAGPAPFDTAWVFQSAGASFSGSPAVGDIQPGGALEVAITSMDSVYVLTSMGTRAPGWPKAVALNPGNGRAPSPVLAPLRLQFSDSSLDVIVCGVGGQLVAWDPTGAVLPGWGSVQVGGTEASPAVADLDGDGSPEVLIGCEDRRLYAFHADGSPVSGFPIETGAEIRSTPAVWDLDGDGSVEIALAGWDAELHVWRYPGSFAAPAMAWPMWRHDNWRTGVYSFPVLTSVRPDPPPPAPAPPPARPRLLQNRPNPFNPSTMIRLSVPGPGPEIVTLRVFDARGRLVATLCSRSLDPGYHDFPWDGRGERGVSLGSGIYFYRASIGRTVLTRKMALLK